MTVKPSTTVDKSQQHIANHQLCSSKAEIGNNCDDGSNDVEHLDSRDGYDVDSELQQPVERLHSLSQALSQLLPGLLASPRASSSDLRLGAPAGACPHQTPQTKVPDDIVHASLDHDVFKNTTHKKSSSQMMAVKKLPRRASSILGINNNAKRKNGVQTSPLEIMSVEDDAVVQRTLGWMVRRQGFDFLPVRNGEEALQVLEDRSKATSGERGLPTLILMAVDLPGMDGYATTKEIRNLYPNAPLPVITLSDDESQDSVQSTFGCGANDLVVKPVSKQNLMTRIGAQLKTLHFWRGQLELTRSEHLLKEMLPEPIINRLKLGERFISDQHEDVTIIFTDIVFFTTLSATHPTQDVIQMLNTLFSEFDKLTDKYGIYKVETIGE